MLLFWRNLLNSNNGLKHITFKSQNSNQYFRSVLYIFSLSQFGILLSETVILNHLLIYILSFTITILSSIILVRLFCGMLLQELRKKTLRMDCTEQTYYTSIKSKTIILNDSNHYSHRDKKVLTNMKFKKKQHIYWIR